MEKNDENRHRRCGNRHIVFVRRRCFWLWASLIKVSTNIDTFIGVLQQIGRVNALGAASACGAAMCGVYTFARSIGFGA